MRNIRTYSASFLMILFCCYYAGISMFSHTHIVNGSSIVHSHLGGDSGHDHSDSQYAVIDILSQFQSESAVDFCSVDTPFFSSAELVTAYIPSSHPNELQAVPTLRGPPQRAY